MTDREKLIELVNDVLKYLPWGQIGSRTAEELADYILADGWIRLPCKVDAKKMEQILSVCSDNG